MRRKCATKQTGRQSLFSHLASCDVRGSLPAMYDGPRERIYFITDPFAGICEKTKETVLNQCPAHGRRENVHTITVYHELAGMYT